MALPMTANIFSSDLSLPAVVVVLVCFHLVFSVCGDDDPSSALHHNHLRKNDSSLPAVVVVLVCFHLDFSVCGDESSKSS